MPGTASELEAFATQNEIVASGYSSEEDLKRFRREYETLVRIQHENVVRLLAASARLERRLLQPSIVMEKSN